MPQLMKDCEKFIEKENAIDCGNFAELWKVADEMKNAQIAEKVNQFVLLEFVEIHRSTGFRCLPLD